MLFRLPAPRLRPYRPLVLLVALRLSTIRDADTIPVMENGSIAEQGGHEELPAAGGAYARLHAAQFARTVET
ncbi:hypothetical protein [Streptomyces sp. NPDC003863]